MKDLTLAIFAIGMAVIANQYHDSLAALFAIIASICLLVSLTH